MSYSFGDSFTSRSPTLTMRRTRSTDRSPVLEDRPLALLLQAVAQRGAHAGQQLVHAERLGDVVVGAEIERLRPCRPRRCGSTGRRSGIDGLVARRSGAAGRGRRCRAGRDRAGSGPASAASCLQRQLAVGRLQHVVALRCQARCAAAGGSAARRRRQDLDGVRAHAARHPAGRHSAGTGRRMVKTAPGRSVRLPAEIVPPIASTKPRQIARPSPVPAPDLVALADAVELVEDALEVRRRNARCPRPSPAARRCHRRPSPAARIESMSGRRVFRGIVEQVEQHLLEQHRVESSIGRSAGKIDLDLVIGEDLARRGAARCRRSRRHRAAPQFGSMAPDSSRVMSSRLAMKRLSRSASSTHGGEQLVAARRRQERCRSSRSVPAAPMIEASGVLQVVRDRGQQRRAQPVGLGRAAWPGRHPRPAARARWRAPPGRPARRAGGAAPASAAARACRCRGRRRRRRRARCASAGTGAWRRAACRRRGRRRGCAPRPSWRRRGRPRRACPRADSRP